MNVTFLPSQICVEVEHLTLLEAAGKAGIPLNGSCGGRGVCGKCRVIADDGRLPDAVHPLDAAERAALTEHELAQGFRLACRVRPTADIEVIVPAVHGTTVQKTMAALPFGFQPDVQVRKYAVQVAKPSLEDQTSDLTRIFKAVGQVRCDALSPKTLENSPEYADYRLLGRVHELLERTGGTVTAVTRGGRLIALEDGKSANRAYGVAFDIGTTTVAAMLCDLVTGEPVAAAAAINPQGVYGADVISRIQYAAQSPEHVRAMQQSIVNCCNGLIDTFAAHGVTPDLIYDLTVVGNTAMSHLILGVDALPLARAPFAPVFSAAVTVDAAELKLHANPAAQVYLPPNIAGHVGSDLVGVLLACGLYALPGVNLAVDIGTNGEILLAANGQAVACSTAAGPAFEGASISQGMRAADGAITGVAINGGELLLTVVGDTVPVGVCGSGLIDAIASLLDAGLLDHTGRLAQREAALARGIPQPLADRLYTDDNGGGFVLYADENHSVALTQRDIREVQLAKGAIAAGISIAMDTLGICAAQLDRVMIAGAFGSTIQTASALRIGLLPPVTPDRVAALGNAAGTGACMALLSAKHREIAEREAARIRHIELSAHPDFMEEHLRAMHFPQ